MVRLLTFSLFLRRCQFIVALLIRHGFYFVLSKLKRLPGASVLRGRGWVDMKRRTGDLQMIRPNAKSSFSFLVTIRDLLS